MVNEATVILGYNLAIIVIYLCSYWTYFLKGVYMFNTKTFKVILTLLSIFVTFGCEEKPTATTAPQLDMEVETDLDLPVQMMHFDTMDIEPDHDVILDMD